MDSKFTFNTTISIGGRQIGKQHRTFIIAEAGVNHNGSIEKAMELIDVAEQAGADAVKFQAFKTKNLVIQSAPSAEYQKRNTNDKQSQFDMLSSLELSFGAFQKLQEYAMEKGLIFLATPFDDESLQLVLDLGLPALKISSGDLTNHPFLTQVASKLIPVILSTGMSTIEEVEDAVTELAKAGNPDLVLLHCTSDYPCDPNDVNLNVLSAMQARFGALVGYSDHTINTITPSIAVGMGATVIEKHFTLDKSMFGPDHAASLSPSELAEMVQHVRLAEKMLGESEKKPTAGELSTRNVARKSIVSTRIIPKGEVITNEHLAIKRPGTGIQPAELTSLLGRIANRDIQADELIEWEWLE